MKIKIDIDIEISPEEIQLLNRIFEQDINNISNYLYHYNNGKSKDGYIIDMLVEKSILIKDQLLNIKLTDVGKKVFDQISRNNIIDKLIN